MMSFLAPAGVAVIYGCAYGFWSGLGAGCLSGFSLFALHIATFPITVESEARKVEREQLNRDVSALVLITAFFGCAIASLLAG